MIMMAGIGLVLLAVFNLDITIRVLIVAFFINYLFMNFRVSVLFVPVVLLSFLITQQHLKKEEFYNPLTKFLLIYFLLCLPSLINCNALGGSLLIATQFIAFITVIYILTSYIKSTSQIKSYIKLFMILSLINAVHVVIQVILYGGRKFGFAGIMFVDYVNIAIIVNLLLVVLRRDRGYLEFIFLLTLALLVIVSVLMQTRNSWVSIAITFGLLVMYLYTKSELYNISRAKIAYFVSVIILLMGITVLFIVSRTDFSDRVTNIEIKEEVDIQEDIGNSLLTRLLIWDTTFRAFSAHPIVGIGWYSFPIVSEQYSQLPEILFEKYVEGLTPHVGYFAVLAETGLIGFSGFILLLFMIIKNANRVVNKSRNREERFIATILLWVLIYITVSLSMTDAWLWGVGIIVWGFFIGLLGGLYRIVNKISIEQ